MNVKTQTTIKRQTELLDKAAQSRLLPPLYVRNQLKIETAPEGAINTENLLDIYGCWKDLSDPCWGFLLFHQLDIPRIAELPWEFCHPTAGYANKIDMLELGFTYMPWVRRCLATVFADIGLIYLDWIAQVTELFSCLAAGLADVNFLSHDFLSFQCHQSLPRSYTFVQLIQFKKGYSRVKQTIYARLLGILPTVGMRSIPDLTTSTHSG